MRLYLLPFDHRHSFLELAGSPEKVREYKQIVYSAFKKAVAGGLSKEQAGILVDETYGKEILLDARKKKFITAYALEKSGQKEFMFGRRDYKNRLKLFKPHYAKVLIRYNPDGNTALNKRQTKKLAGLSKYLIQQKIKFLLEVLAPPTEGQKKADYDSALRPKLVVKAIRELQLAGVNPDIWKLEGMDNITDLEKIAQIIKPNSRIIILGRGESRQKAEQWLKIGSKVDKVIGFAIGRTVFQQPLLNYKNKKINKQQAINQIMKNYLHFVNVFERGG